MPGRLTIWEWIIAGAAGLLAAGVVLSATSVYGAGVSSDSMFYISSADNLARGDGLVDFGGGPLIDFPPLYSFILGIMTWISGVSPFVLGRYANAAIIALLVISTGVLLRRCFPERRIWFYLGVLATVIFLPLYTLAANIATDLLYILLTIWFCLAVQSFLENQRFASLAAMTVLAAAGALLRWIGLALVASQFILVLIAYRRDLKKAFTYAAISSGLAFLPAALWIGVHNFLLSGTWGRAGGNRGMVDVLQNLKLTVDRMLAWTSPAPKTTFLLLVIVTVLAILFLNRRADYRRWLNHLSHNPILPVTLLTAVYFVAVTLTGYTNDHLRSFDDRYQAPLYYFLLVFLFLSLDELIFSHLQGLPYKLAMLGVVGVFGMRAVYRLPLLDDFVRTAKEQGVVAYNDYNTKKMVRSGLVVYLIKNPPPPDLPIYSNEPEALYFFLRRKVEMSPVDRSHYTADPEALKLLYPRWPAEEAATLVWFKPSAKRHYYNPDEIEKLADLEKIYKRWDGEIYIARPKK